MEGFSIYIGRVCKQVDCDTGISSKAMSTMTVVRLLLPGDLANHALSEGVNCGQVQRIKVKGDLLPLLPPHLSSLQRTLPRLLLGTSPEPFTNPQPASPISLISCDSTNWIHGA